MAAALQRAFKLPDACCFAAAPKSAERSSRRRCLVEDFRLLLAPCECKRAQPQLRTSVAKICPLIETVHGARPPRTEGLYSQSLPKRMLVMGRVDAAQKDGETQGDMSNGLTFDLAARLRV